MRLSFADGTQARRFLIETAGHVLSERPRLEHEGRWTDLEGDLDRLIRERNGADGRGVQLDCEYLLVLAAHEPRLVGPGEPDCVTRAARPEPLG
ncbi:MAG TPA: hypothetical protein VFN55_10190 [Solirubrobacteraceae bacterium]|nr:hypothetical protein [Solirubrobacteraceae bacterium]